jgi:hypothetical protein
MGNSRRHIAWKALRDGSRWGQFEISKAPAVAAVTELEPGRFAVNVVVELPGSWGSAEEAEHALEDWVAGIELGAQVGRRARRRLG